MQLRAFESKDLNEILRLFYETVREVNAKDYSSGQIAAWTDGVSERETRWAQSLAANDTLVAVDLNGEIAGFGDIDHTGYLDHLFVQKDHQRQGVAAALCDALEDCARVRGLHTVITHASITAKPFFAQRGYRVLREQQLKLGTNYLINFVMEKQLDKGE